MWLHRLAQSLKTVGLSEQCVDERLMQSKGLCHSLQSFLRDFLLFLSQTSGSWFLYVHHWTTGLCNSWYTMRSCTYWPTMCLCTHWTTMCLFTHWPVTCLCSHWPIKVSSNLQVKHRIVMQLDAFFPFRIVEYLSETSKYAADQNVCLMLVFNFFIWLMMRIISW